MIVQKSFGLTLTNVFGVPDALVSYFKWYGGQPAGKEHCSMMVEWGDRTLVGTIKGGLKS